MGSTYVAGTYIPISAQIFGPTLEPLPVSSKPEAVLTPPAGVPAPPKVILRPTSAEATGWFEGRVLLMQPGEYRVSIQIPGGGEPLSRKFIVKESNPEMDNVRPDLGQLYQVASDA